MLNAGELTEAITLERDALTYASGVETRTAAPYAALWAKIVPLAGREYWAAQELNSEAKYKVRIRYRDDVLPPDRVVWGARKLEILDVQLNRVEWETTLICKALNG